jgi:hypothetical protein
LHTCSLGNTQDSVFMTPFSKSDMTMFGRLSSYLTWKQMTAHILEYVEVSLLGSNAYMQGIARLWGPICPRKKQIWQNGSGAVSKVQSTKFIVDFTHDPGTMSAHEYHHQVHLVVIHKVSMSQKDSACGGNLKLSSLSWIIISQWTLFQHWRLPESSSPPVWPSLSNC